MDKLLENAERYFSILKRCSSLEVGSWKTEDLDRALHWADYFHKVHGRIAHKVPVVQKLDTQLREYGQRLGFRFGREEFGFEFLGHSLDYLIKALLENPVLPSTLREKILQRYPSDSHIHKHLEDFSSDQLLLEKLSTVHTKLVECLTTTARPPPTAMSCSQASGKMHKLWCDASYFCETIMWHLKLSPSHRLNDAAQKLLDGLLQQDNGMEVILLALAQPPEEVDDSTSPVPADSAQQYEQAQRATLQWLLQKAAAPPTAIPSNHSTSPGQQCSVTERLWRAPPKLLAQVSKQHLEFFQTHVRHLVSQVNELGQSQQACVSTLSVGSEQKFHQIVCHFEELIMSGDCIKEVCTYLVESKVQEDLLEGSCSASMDGTLDVWSKLRLRLGTLL